MTIKYLKVVGNDLFRFPPQASCNTAPCSQPEEGEKRDDIQLDPQLGVPSPSVSIA